MQPVNNPCVYTVLKQPALTMATGVTTGKLGDGHHSVCLCHATEVPWLLENVNQLFLRKVKPTDSDRASDYTTCLSLPLSSSDKVFTCECEVLHLK